MILAVDRDDDEGPPLYTLVWYDVPSLKFLGGVVSARTGRPVVVLVRLLLMLRIAQWEEMKNFVSTEPSAYQKL